MFIIFTKNSTLINVRHFWRRFINNPTLHNTKGLEFRRVIMTGIEQGVFPRDDKSGEDLEEERRLFYVGATRAMDELYLTSCAYRRMYGRTEPMEPSLFLREIDRTALRIIGRPPQDFAVPSTGGPRKSASSSDGRWTLGDRVFHDDHGYGSITQIGEFFPGCTFRLYTDEGSLFRALGETGFSNDLPLRDPAFPLDGRKKSEPVPSPLCVSFWRPFLKPDENYNTPILLPVLPWPLGPAVLVLEKHLDASFPVGGLIPPVLLAPAARALYNLAAKIHKADRQRYPKIEKVLGGSRASPWRRRGIYLTVEPETDKEPYEALFRRFLEGGFLIPPSPREPLILPASMSDGEESKLAALL